MTNMVVGRKGCSLERCLLIAGLLAISCLPAGAARKGTFGFGIQAGSSLGFRPEFGLHGPLFYYGLRLYHTVGGHIQYNFSDRFGLRFDLAYQNGAYMSFSLDHQTKQWGLVTEGSSFSYYSLNGVYSFSEWKNMGFFLLAGAGSGSGDDWIYGPDGFWVFTGGAGVNIFLCRNGSWAISPGLLFHHLYDPISDYRGSDIHGSWISFNIGVEFAPRVRAD